MRRGPDRKSEFLRALKDEGTGELTTGSSPGTSGEVTPLWVQSDGHVVCLWSTDIHLKKENGQKLLMSKNSEKIKLVLF